MEAKYRILIELGNNKIEIESTDKDWVEIKQKELVKYFEITSDIKHNQTKSTDSFDLQKVNSKITINEFYRTYCNGIKVTTDIAVFFIYYLNWIEKKKEISTNQIKALFIKVGIPKANTLNYSDILAKAKKRALLNFIDNSWSLTITGEDFVLNKMQTKKDK